MISELSAFEDELNYCKRASIDIDLDAIEYNLLNMKKNINESTMMMAVIKTNGYGHGAVQIAKLLEKYDFVFGYAVAAAQEASLLRKNGVKKPILILGYTFPYSYEYFVLNDIRPTVFTYEMIDELSEVAVKLNKKVKVHIKVDTGMSRIGIMPDEAGFDLVKYAADKPGIELEGIFTHFARADEFDKENVLSQLKRFNDFCDKLDAAKINIPIKHCSNSAAIIELRQANMNMVRAGITLYGLYPSDEVDKESVLLRPALSLKSSVVFVKTINKGTQVSYGGTFTAKEDMRLATVSIGYGDGYPRSLSNKGYVLINGERASIIGRVCMDQFMVDVTHIEDVKVGDTVTLIGKDKDEVITAEQLGELSGRFNYELVCDLNERLPRIYWKDNKIIDISSIV